MKNCGIVAMTAASLLLANIAAAADYTNGPARICIPIRSAQLLLVEENVDLSNQVVDMMNEAVSVADDPVIIANSRPAFTWANEAKIACGKAIGYLAADYRDEQYLNKCECFYQRMQSYLR